PRSAAAGGGLRHASAPRQRNAPRPRGGGDRGRAVAPRRTADARRSPPPPRAAVSCGRAAARHRRSRRRAHAGRAERSGERRRRRRSRASQGVRRRGDRHRTALPIPPGATRGRTRTHDRRTADRVPVEAVNAMLTVGLLLAWTIAAAPIQGTAPADDYASIDAWIDAGAWDRAEEALRHAALPPSARARLQGKLALQRGDYERASEAFTTALAAAPDDATLRLYLARALLELGRAAEALAALDGTASWARRSVAQPLLHARALTLLGRDGEAYAVLREAAERFPNDPAPRLELVVSCARLELFDTALAWARTLPTTSLDVARAIVVALHRHGAALPLLEQIVAQHPRAVDLVVALAHGYAAQGHPAAAARLFARATALGDDQVHAAADQLRLAGDHRAALTMNARVADPAARVRQRLA